MRSFVCRKPQDDFVSVLLDMQCIAEAEPEGLVRVLSLALQRGRLRVLGQMCMSDAPSTHDIEMEQAIQLMHEALACGRCACKPLYCCVHAACACVR